jgi:hypothetical protein
MRHARRLTVSKAVDRHRYVWLSGAVLYHCVGVALVSKGIVGRHDPVRNEKKL